MTKQPQFPLIDLSITEWSTDVFPTIIMSADTTRGSNQDFKDHLFGNLLADGNGNLFKIKGREKLASWRRFVPFMETHRYLFEHQSKQVTFNEVKEYIVKGIGFLTDSELKAVCEEELNKCSNLKDIIESFNI
ncbi:hypothetical protein FUA48_11290 [Flavobacterium alkalisoli]|uniref:Uncharacterized protein n=1 Tax=Flavobacterium alkalisoli TaxID=2602769 RepID=A0A5B9FTH3_9FLAO|nr:hypothetical protein [Flavobacterium alkalisoli]QEE50144.1 hypothetical protein FUA48_11290 [Flavobacterium alkalisoli]